eukprot:4619348-Prymnesium_polylepis.1
MQGGGGLRRAWRRGRGAQEEGCLTSEELLAKYKHAASPHFDPEKHLRKIGLANQTTMYKKETQARRPRPEPRPEPRPKSRPHLHPHHPLTTPLTHTPHPHPSPTPLTHTPHQTLSPRVSLAGHRPSLREDDDGRLRP